MKRELILFGLYSLFFLFFFTIFTVYRWLMIGALDDASLRLGYNLIEAIVLAKTVLVGQKLRLGERFENRPLIVPTLYKTAIFTVFVSAFSLIEEFVFGHLKGKGWGFLWQELLQTGYRHILAKVLLMAFVLFFFFAFLELARAIGKEKLYRLFFKKNHL